MERRADAGDALAPGATSAQEDDTLTISGTRTGWAGTSARIELLGVNEQK